MDFRKIKKLIELLQFTGIAEIEIHEGEESIRIQLNNTVAPSNVTNQTTQVSSTSPIIEITKSQSDQVVSPKPQQQIRAPMVGTVYLSSSPGTKPFVEIGQMIKKGDIICLIEAMKMFNHIEADKSGKIVARLVENGSSVEYNQSLFIIEE